MPIESKIHSAGRPLEYTIEPRKHWLLDFRELWAYRELLFFLTWRDVAVRYKQTVLGVVWAILQPVLMMVVFTVVFGRMAKVPTGNTPYPIFVYAGLLPWTFFSRAISAAAESVVHSERLVTKIYFPRLLIPFSSVGAALVDLAISCGVLIVLMTYYRVAPSPSLLLIPPLCLLITMAALGFGCVIAALNVAYRDIRYVVPYFVQFWLFATPTVYMEVTSVVQPPASVAPQTFAASTDQPPGAAEDTPSRFEALLKANPMTGLIAFFRAAVLGRPLPWHSLAYPLVVISLMFGIGVMFFRRVEASFADIV